MSFSVGDVEATLKLDRTPFTQGLDQAKRDVEAFEREHHQVTEHVDVQGLAEAKAELAELDKRHGADVQVHDAEAKAKLDALALKLDEIGRKRERPQVDSSGIDRVAASARGASGKVSLLAAAVAGLGPALVPIGAVAVGVGAALGGAFAAAGAGALAFGLAAKSSITSAAQNASKLTALQTQYNNAVDDKQRQAILRQEQVLWSKIPPEQRSAVLAMQGIQGQLGQLQSAAQPFVGQLLRIGSSILTSVMPALQGLVRAGGQGFVRLGQMAQHALAGPFWQGFLRFLTQQAPGAIVAFGRTLGNLAHGFAAIMMAFKPLIPGFEQGLVHGSAMFAAWASGLGKSQGFQRFLAYLHQALPAVGQFLRQLVPLVTALARSMAQQGLSTLRAVTSLLMLVNAFMRAHPQIASFLLAAISLGVIFVKVVGPVVTLISWFSKLGTVISVLGTVFEVLGGIIGAIVGVVSLPVVAIVAAVAAIVAAGYFLITNWKAVESAIVAVWHAIEAAAVFVFNAIKTALTTIVRAIVTVYVTEFNVMKAVLIGIWDGIKAAASAVWDAIKFVIVTPVNAVSSALTSVWNGISRVLTGLWHGIEGVASTIWNGVKSAIVTPIQQVWSWITGLAGDFFNAGWNLIKSLWDGIAKIFSQMWSWVKGALHSLRDLLPFSEPRDPSSPLRGLGKAGEAMMRNMALGILSGAPLAAQAARNALAGVQRSLQGGAGFNLTGTASFAGTGGISGSGAGSSGTPVIAVTVQHLHAANQSEMRNFELGIVRASNQITRAQGRRGG